METETVVMNIKPSWGQVAVIKAVTGVPGNVLRMLVNEHRVRAKKCPPNTQTATTVFSVSDVEDWLANEAKNAGPFKVPAGKAAV